MKKTIFSCLIACSMSLGNVYAETSSKDSLSELLKTMHSFKAHFTQTIVDNKGNAVQLSTGEMQLQRPGHFRWDVKSPTKQLIVTNGKRLWIYDPDLDQVTIRSLAKTAGETPALLLSDEHLALGDEFTIKALKQDSSLDWYVLTPRDQSAVIASLKLGFANQQIKQMHIKDHLGHVTRIEFSQAKMNIPISSASFDFKPPRNVDIIDETKSKQ